VVGAAGEVRLIETFEGRSQLFASYHMWHIGLPAADQCEGCTFNTGHVLELSYLHSRDVTFAVFCQDPYDESARYRDFMGLEMPWYSVPWESSDRLIHGASTEATLAGWAHDDGRIVADSSGFPASGCPHGLRDTSQARRAARSSGHYALVIDVRRASAELARDWPHRSMRKGLMSERDLNSHLCDLRLYLSGSG
jgi:hypothetical protein